MLRNLNVVATDMFGEPLQFPTGKSEPKTETQTFCRIIVGALGHEVEGEARPGVQIDGGVKMERFALGLKLRALIGKDEDVELSEREVALIKQATEPKFTTMVIGPLFTLLEAK